MHLFIKKILTHKLFQFLLAGLPGFLIGLLLNIWLVSRLEWNEALAYSLVLGIQVSINFIVCRYLVFDRDPEKSILYQYISFMGNILSARLLDWLSYSLLTLWVPEYYIAIQFFNIVLFSLWKFKWSQRIFEKDNS